MADHFYSLTIPGQAIGAAEVVKGTSTASGNFELRITDGVSGNSKVAVLKALEAIANFIATDSAPA